MTPAADLRPGMVVWYSDPWDQGYFTVAKDEPGILTLVRPDGTHFTPSSAYRDFSVRAEGAS